LSVTCGCPRWRFRSRWRRQRGRGVFVVVIRWGGRPRWCSCWHCSHPRCCRSCCPIRSRRRGREWRRGVGWAARVRGVVLAVVLVVFVFGGLFRWAFVSAGRRRGSSSSLALAFSSPSGSRGRPLVDRPHPSTRGGAGFVWASFASVLDAGCWGCAARARLLSSHSRRSTLVLPLGSFTCLVGGVGRCVYATVLAALVVLADLSDVAVVFC